MRKKRAYRPYEGRRGKLWLRVLLLLVLLGAAVFCALEGIVFRGDRTELVGAPKVMVIFGCKVESWGPSVLLQDRLDTALDYLANHPDMTVIVSGGKGDDEHISEAQCMYDYLTAHGVSGERVWLEDQSRNTWQNVNNTLALLEREERDLTEDVLLVSSGFHLTRIRMLWDRGMAAVLADWAASGQHVSTLAAPASHVPSRIHMFFREPLALVKSFLLDR